MFQLQEMYGAVTSVLFGQVWVENLKKSPVLLSKMAMNSCFNVSSSFLSLPFSALLSLESLPLLGEGFQA